MSAANRRHPWLAVTLSLLLPGLGLIYAGEVVRGAAVMAAAGALACGAFYYLFPPATGLGLPGLYALLALAVFLFGLADSYLSARRQNTMLNLAPLAGKDPYLAAFLTILLPGLGHLYCGKILATAVVLALWGLLQLPVIFISLWLFPLVPVCTVLMAVHAHSMAPESKTRRQGMRLFIVTALIVLTAVMVLALFGREPVISALRAKF